MVGSGPGTYHAHISTAAFSDQVRAQKPSELLNHIICNFGSKVAATKLQSASDNSFIPVGPSEMSDLLNRTVYEVGRGTECDTNLREREKRSVCAFTKVANDGPPETRAAMFAFGQNPKIQEIERFAPKDTHTHACETVSSVVDLSPSAIDRTTADYLARSQMLETKATALHPSAKPSSGLRPWAKSRLSESQISQAKANQAARSARASSMLEKNLKQAVTDQSHISDNDWNSEGNLNSAIVNTTKQLFSETDVTGVTGTLQGDACLVNPIHYHLYAAGPSENRSGAYPSEEDSIAYLADANEVTKDAPWRATLSGSGASTGLGTAMGQMTIESSAQGSSEA